METSSVNSWFIHESKMGKMAEITCPLIDIQEASVFYRETTKEQKGRRGTWFTACLANLFHMAYNIASKNHAKLLITQ